MKRFNNSSLHFLYGRSATILGMAKVNILLVEDNTDMRHAVSSFLRDIGYGVVDSPDAERVMQSRAYSNCDLAILDISLPRMSGLELTQHMRSDGFSEPIIGLTARDTVDDKVTGLETGMNDYIIKPFDLRELEARVKAQLRMRSVHNDLQPIKTKNFKIEPRRHKFFMGDEEIKLTVVEFRLMLKLMQHNHAVVTSNDLIDFAWGSDENVINPPIRIHISNLRSKIGDKDLSIIATVPGTGYIFQD
jgi:DNA-binding response OmpR family regulator